MKKLVALVLLIVCLAGCGRKSDAPPPQDVPPVESEKIELDSRADQIVITSEIDETLMQVILTAENKSDATFSGKMFFIITSGTTTVDGGYITVDALPAGQKSTSKIDVDTTENLIIDAEVSEAEFSETTNTAAGEIDATASEELTAKFDGSFGYEEFATSWHKYVDKIEVYDAEPRYVIITINGGSDDDITMIGNTVFANYKKDFDFRLVVVQNSSSEELWRREQ